MEDDSSGRGLKEPDLCHLWYRIENFRKKLDPDFDDLIINQIFFKTRHQCCAAVIILE